MRYSELVDIYEKLEATSSKLGKTGIIADVLKAAPAELLPKLVMLFYGTVFPPWSEEKIGVADKMMIRAVAKAVGMKESEVVASYRKTGDLGLSAEQLIAKKRQKRLAARALDVNKVFDTIQKIARQTGAGSQESKTALIVELLSVAQPKEAKYIVRTVLEQLRMGVAEGIVRDAIAKAFGIDADIVESAWYVRPDYGEVAKIAKERGVAGLKKIELVIGMPIMVQLAEKAPDLKSAVEAFKRPVLEYKYDGARIAVHKKGDKFWLYTRRLENVTEAFPDVVETCKKALMAKECIVEGEALAIDPKTKRPQPFQRLSQRIKRKYDIAKVAKEIPVNLHVFDIVYLNGRTLFDKSLEERFNILKKTVKPIADKIEFARRLIPKDLKEAEAFYKKALSEGQEGLIVKNLDALYTPGRRVAGGWLKVKPVMETLDLAIIGATWGTGKRAGWLGSLILGIRDPETGKFLECGMLGTGIKEKKTRAEDVTFEDMTKMLKPYIISQSGHDVKIKPKIIIEVAYEEIQKSPTYSSGFALRFPRFIRLRPDKGPAEADDLNRIKALFEIQKGKAPAETGEK
ncbi:MAG: ATP-dependent DNA ligase [Candidatus Aenigmatarchaeota archaeon]